MKLGTDIHGLLKMTPTDFGDNMTFNVAPP